MPLEILVRGKDAEQNSKQFEKCIDVIKSAGVRKTQPNRKGVADMPAEESRDRRQRQLIWAFCGGVEGSSRRHI